MMEYCDYGSNDKVRSRRISIITLQERGLKPSEIRKEMEKHNPDITMQTVYSDVKWGITNVKRADREKLWDKHFMKELEAELKLTDNQSNTIGFMKLLLSHRQDMRKRHGLYVEKIEHSGGDRPIIVKKYMPED